MSEAVRVRPATAADAGALSDLLNAIVRAGGTTATEVASDAASFAATYIDGPAAVCCMIAETDAGPLGFQVLGREGHLPADWADIGTFTAAAARGRGVGRALLAQIRAAAEAGGFAAIHAIIRADNAQGLAYYDAMGFRTFETTAPRPLRDGTPVPRVRKLLALA